MSQCDNVKKKNFDRFGNRQIVTPDPNIKQSSAKSLT